ncbi:MAG: hypothetical protein SO314_00915 [Alphaproteobacteria bacterium]|nr:hypothetical protein [Alphaproteobacteria bacterium]
MKKTFLLLLLLLLSFETRAACKKFAHDLSGKLISTRCGSANPEFACPPLRAWDGRNCVKIPIVERCRSFGGQWLNAQFIYNKNQSVFLDICQCPAPKVWNGNSCAAVALVNTCTSYSQDCIPVHIRLLRQKNRSRPIISCEQFPQCTQKQK